MKNKNLPIVLYRFDHPADHDRFVGAFQNCFKLLICDSNEQAEQTIVQYGPRIDALVLDQDEVDETLPTLCRSINPHLLSIQLHQDIALAEIVSLLDSALIGNCFAKPYDINIIRSVIYTAAMGVNTKRQTRLDFDHSNQNFSVLLVDDEKIATKFLSKQLQRLDCPCQILVADNAEQALEIFSAQKDNIAIIISDQRMPGITGNQLLNEIQKYSPHIIRMLTSAYEEVDIALNAVNEGRISRYITKPWNAEEINSIIKLALYEFQSRLSLASEQEADIIQQYQVVLAQRQTHLSQALAEVVDNFGGQDALDNFYHTLQSMQALLPNKASLRASQETTIETQIVADFSELVIARLSQISLKTCPALPPEKMLEILPQLLDSDAGQADKLIYDACNSSSLDIEILASLQQLLQSSGLDFSSLELIESDGEYVLKTKTNCYLSLYRHILSAHTQFTIQLLHQQCEMLMLVIICRKLGLKLQIEGRKQSFTLSITYSK